MEYEEKKASWIMPEDMEGNREKMKDFLRFRGRKRVGRCSLHAKVNEPWTVKVVIALVAAGTLSRLTAQNMKLSQAGLALIVRKM